MRACIPHDGDDIARAFFAATASGDVGALQAMLAETVVLHADGGGRVHAWLNPIGGAARLLRLFAGLHRESAGEPRAFLGPLRIDGLPGYVSLERGGVLQTTALRSRTGGWLRFM